jgi:ATP-binding cassette, subfamily B, bacterial
VTRASRASRFRRLLPYATRRWRPLAVVLALTILGAGATALQPWPLKILIDVALGDEAIPGGLSRALDLAGVTPSSGALIVLAGVASLVLFVLTSITTVGLTRGWAAAGERMTLDLAEDMLATYQRLSLAFHARRTVGDSLSRLTGDSYGVYTITNALLIAPVQHLLTIAAIGVVAWNLDARLTLLSMVLAPLMTASAIFFASRLKRRALQAREAESRLMSFVQQTLTSVPIVQAFSSERHNQDRFRALATDAVAVSQRVSVVQGSRGLIDGLIATAGTAVVLFVGGQGVLAGSLSLGTLLVFLAYVYSLQEALMGLHGTFGNLKMAEASIDRVFEVLDAEERLPEVVGAGSLPARVVGHVRLEGVTFGYEPGVAVLRGVDVEARAGEVVAVVGATGVGKSTLVSLIPRFFDPWEGRVSIDGVDVRDVRLASVRAQVAVVLQDPFVLPLTVAENIAYGRPGAGRDEVVAAAVAANADGFVGRLPFGFDTVVGERGLTLSGGEKQRLAIARALLKDAPILILDEPTSALDAATEASILQALERLMRGRTTFIIAHRLSTIRRADKIVVLKDGVVAESGTHDELLALGGEYGRFHAQQLGSLRVAG